MSDNRMDKTVCVPVEPDTETLKRMHKANDSWFASDGDRMAYIYKAAISAAPAATAQGQWVCCTPDLLKAGVDCAKTPRRPGDGTYSHDHFIAHEAATAQQDEREIALPEPEFYVWMDAFNIQRMGRKAPEHVHARPYFSQRQMRAALTAQDAQEPSRELALKMAQEYERQRKGRSMVDSMLHAFFLYRAAIPTAQPADKPEGKAEQQLTSEQLDRCRRLTLDYAICVFDAKGGRMVNTAWVCEQLEDLKNLPIDASVITGKAEQQAKPQSTEKALYWFSVLVKCARLLNLPDDEPIPSGVLAAVERLTSNPPAQPQLSDAEFLSKRLARVAKLVGVPMPDMTHAQIAEVAGTILGQIATRLEFLSSQSGDKTGEVV